MVKCNDPVPTGDEWVKLAEQQGGRMEYARWNTQRRGSASDGTGQIRIVQELSAYTENLLSERSDFVAGFVAKHCKQLREQIEDLNAKRPLSVRTQELYELISGSFSNFEKIDVVDQDFPRWFEILPDHHEKVSAVINYSDDILSSSVRQAVKNPGYLVRRVFILTPEDVKGEKQNKTIRTMAAIMARIKGVEENIQNKYFFTQDDGAPETKSALLTIREIEDVVIAKTDDETILMREQITYERRAKAKDTSSQITSDKDDVKNAQNQFEDLFGLSLPINENEMKLLFGEKWEPLKSSSTRNAPSSVNKHQLKK